ncbi:DNA polymerase IV [Microlunatus panaciterrae]|uniref:DNA polymerase IV n=1 Tax=Microlunatus panaciterrae TaxID=400768 RepID=A0ABS2RIN1_9ACTN|nr:DNA polymerase IV [Microlunatus panaciterrae]MBM7798827.1 DNA polymerase-4 [Microlunatus panaciterrae]
MTAWVLHVDLDQFIAAVEVLRHPELAGRPVVVGGRGDPTERGVVSTASYEARAFGVSSGLPLRVAVRRCPDAVFLPVDAAHYAAASAQVMEALRATGAVVQTLGWDEAFLGVDTDDPEAYAEGVRASVLAATRLHCSVGIGDNKLRAKIATGFAKPRGVFRLTRDNWFAVMADRPTDALWGVGRKTAKRLAGLGIGTVEQLARADPAVLADRLGPTMGPWYQRLARGVGDAVVDAAAYQARSHSRETTFQTDLEDWSRVETEVRRLSRQVCRDLADEGRPAVRVALKVRYAPFDTHTRSVTLGASTTDPALIEQAAVGLIDRFDHDRAVRLLGVRAEMAPPGSAVGG